MKGGFLILFIQAGSSLPERGNFFSFSFFKWKSNDDFHSSRTNAIFDRTKCGRDWNSHQQSESMTDHFHRLKLLAQGGLESQQQVM